MSEQKLRIEGKSIGLHGCVINPDFRSQRVLCSDPGDFVSLWLKKQHKPDALFYWDQAKQFFHASKSLHDLSAPLTTYYGFLNATKALLSAKGQPFKETHGVGGRSLQGHKSLKNEIIDFQGSGILHTLCKYLGEQDNAGKEISLQDIFWQIPFIHRAYCLTYKNTTELFIPILSNCFMRKDGSKEAWFQAEIAPQYINGHTKEVIEPGFEIFTKNEKSFIRRKRRFSWSGKKIESSIKEFIKYHKTIRLRIAPIYSSENRWYLKKNVTGHDKLNNSQLVLMYAAMHRLSELSRYQPVALSGHFNVNHNWLLSEFIRLAPGQFMYGIASEITGLEFIQTDAF